VSQEGKNDRNFHINSRFQLQTFQWFADVEPRNLPWANSIVYGTKVPQNDADIQGLVGVIATL
jgi:hypothetical protein